MKSLPLILIVDDVPKNLQVLGNLLREKECEIAVATNGKQALDIVKKTKPDLILLDVMMPEMDGYTACGHLKEDPETRDIPVIFLTAKVETDDIVKGFKAGAVDYVTKPFNGVELMTRVNTHLELKKTRDELQLALKSKNKFFDIIAHDLKNPFNTILGFADLLSKNGGQLDPENQQKYTSLILQSAKGAFDLLGNLLEWSRIQIGRIEAKPKNFPVSDLFSATIDLIAGSAEKKQITLHQNASENMVVHADFNMISTVLRNLVSNAIKFTPEMGDIFLSGEELDGQNIVQITVEDSGVGIPAGNLKKLFRIDEKFTTKGTAEEPGTGLGLILCKDFVEKNGGEIRVESEEGEGSSFIFTLPKG